MPQTQIFQWTRRKVWYFDVTGFGIFIATENTFKQINNFTTLKHWFLL